MGRLEGILVVQQVWEGQGPVSGGIFNWQTLDWQKPDGMALAASVALRESESKERSQGEQREQITRQRAVRREEAFTVREKQVPLGTPWGKGGREPFPILRGDGVLWSQDGFTLLQSCPFCLEYSSDPVLLT